MTSKDSKRDNAYVVIPQKEYARLYNRQYAELTTLKKSIDPQDKHSDDWSWRGGVRSCFEELL